MMDSFFNTANDIDDFLDELEKEEEIVVKSKPVKDSTERTKTSLSSQFKTSCNQYTVDAVTNKEIENGILGTTSKSRKYSDNSANHRMNDTKASLPSPFENNQIQTNLKSIESLSSENQLDPIKKTNMNHSNAESQSNTQLLIDILGEFPFTDSSAAAENDDSINQSTPAVDRTNLLIDYISAEGVSPLVKVSESSGQNSSVDSIKDSGRLLHEEYNPTTSKEFCDESVPSNGIDNEKIINDVPTGNESQNMDHNYFEGMIGTISVSMPGATEEDTTDVANESLVERHGVDEVPVLVSQKDSKNIINISNNLQPTMEQQHETNDVNDPREESFNNAEVIQFTDIANSSNTTQVLDAEISDAAPTAEFPKEITVTDEEFEQFWNDNSLGIAQNDCGSAVESALLNSESTKPEVMATEETKNKCIEVESSQDNAVLPSLNAGNSLVDGTSNKNLVTSTSAAVEGRDSGDENSMGEATFAGSTSADHSVTEILDLSSDFLISEQEFENFISESQGDDASKPISQDLSETIQRVPDAENANIESREERDVAVAEDSIHFQNSMTPTDQHPPNDYPSPSYSASVEPGVEHPHSLEFANADMRRPYEDSAYPATPPPPYSLSEEGPYQQTPRMQDSDARDTEESNMSTQSPDSSQSRGEQMAEDDAFSFLPSSILSSITRPGETKPDWIPDADSPQCSNCAIKFTFTRRRHHCRACGRVFCASCCSMKSQLKYLGYKEVRVCSMCNLAIMQESRMKISVFGINTSMLLPADALAQMANKAQMQAASVSSTPVNSQHSPEQMEIQQADEGVAATEEQPEHEAILRQNSVEIAKSNGILRPLSRELSSSEDASDMGAVGGFRTTGGKIVRFSDGTRPKHPDELPTTPPPPSRVNRRRRIGRSPTSPDGVKGLELPPIIIAYGENGSYAVEENPDMNVITGLLESGGPGPQSFVLNPNLVVHVKLIMYVSKVFWCFWSEGLDGVGQSEVSLLLEREGEEDKLLPHDVFNLYGCIFDRARKGKIINNTDFMPTTLLGAEQDEEIFGLTTNAGFLFVQLTSQPLEGLECLKQRIQSQYKNEKDSREIAFSLRSMLFTIIVQKSEAPWATLFPMRLMLRLGVQNNQYPCPLFSIRKRLPVYHQLGHTILAILCDFRNFKYRVVSVPGLRVIVMSSGSISIQIPCNRFTDMMKIMNSSNESVLAIGTGTFGPKCGPVSSDDRDSHFGTSCDSHLVCVQDKATLSYRTEVMSMHNTDTVFTGAAFVIFNGSLKSEQNEQAKCAIVEDGIMIQLLREKMSELRASLKSMEDFQVHMGSNLSTSLSKEDSHLQSDSSAVHTPQQPVIDVRWVEDDTSFNIGMFSPIDGTPFEGVVGFNVQGRSEQRGRKHTLRWNQVFFLASTSNPLDMSRLAEQVANGCFLALTPVLQELVKHGQNKVSVRVTIHPDNVEYVAGSGGRPLPPSCMNTLDEHLIPTIHNAAANVHADQEAVVIELLFAILLLRPGYRTV